MATMRPLFKRVQRLLEHENAKATAFMRILTPDQRSQFYPALRANSVPMAPGDDIDALPEPERLAWLAEAERLVEAERDPPGWTQLSGGRHDSCDAQGTRHKTAQNGAANPEAAQGR